MHKLDTCYILQGLLFRGQQDDFCRDWSFMDNRLTFAGTALSWTTWWLLQGLIFHGQRDDKCFQFCPRLVAGDVLTSLMTLIGCMKWDELLPEDVEHLRPTAGKTTWRRPASLLWILPSAPPRCAPQTPATRQRTRVSSHQDKNSTHCILQKHLSPPLTLSGPRPFQSKQPPLPSLKGVGSAAHSYRGLPWDS